MQSASQYFTLICYSFLNANSRAAGHQTRGTHCFCSFAVYFNVVLYSVTFMNYGSSVTFVLDPLIQIDVAADNVPQVNPWFHVKVKY